MKSFPLEQLPNETILKVIDKLTLWDAFALEATSKRMHDLVRVHQKVQTFVDITMAMQVVSEEREWKCKHGIEKVLLTRFGPNLRKIKWIKEYEEYYHIRLFYNESFVGRLSIACPNLIELPTYYIPALIAYVGSRSVGLKKIVMRQGSFTAAQMELLLTNCSQLEDLTIESNEDEDWDRGVIKAVEASLPVGNKIRRLRLDYALDSKATLIQVFKRLISKLPRLEHFNLEVAGTRGVYLLGKSCNDHLTDLFAMIKCSKSLEAKFAALELAPTLATHVTRMDIKNNAAVNINEELMKFTNLNQLELCFYHIDLPPFLVIPQTVRKLDVLFFAANMNIIERCIRNQGKQLESIALNYSRILGPNWELNSLQNQLLRTNQLLVALTECSTTLKSLNLAFEHLYGFDSEHLRTFVRTCGKSLERFHVDKQLLSLSTLRLISTECKSLVSFNFSFSIEKKKDKSQIIKMKKLLKGMSNLYEAEVTIKHFNEVTDKLEDVAECEYANGKFIMCRGYLRKNLPSPEESSE